MEYIIDFIKQFTNKLISNVDLEYNENCKKFCKDLKICIEENKNISGKFDMNNESERYYNFFEFDEYKKINKYTVKEISFNPNDISYPYNSYYKITNNDGRIKIKFYD